MPKVHFYFVQCAVCGKWKLKKTNKKTRFILVFMIDFPQVFIYVEGKRDQFIKK